MPHSWLVVFEQWLRRWLVRPALDKHARPHSLQTNCDRSGLILSPFLAALFVLAQIFALSWKQRDPLYTIVLHLFLSHATISQSGSSVLLSASESLTQSLKRFFGLCCRREPKDSSPYSSCLGIRSSSSRTTWPTQRRRCQWMCASVLIVFAFSKTSVSGVWVIQWIPRIDLRHRWWKRSSGFKCLGTPPTFHMSIEGMSYTYIHTYIHTYILTCLHTYIHLYIHLYIHTYIHTYLHTYMSTYIYTYMHTYIHTYIHAYIHTYILTYIHKYIHTYIHICMHACMHTYMQTYRIDAHISR